MSIWVVSQKQRLLSHVGQKPFLFLKSQAAGTGPSIRRPKYPYQILEENKNEKEHRSSRVLTLALAASAGPVSLRLPGRKSDDNSTGSSGAASYQVGICNYVDDASLNQIVDNIRDAARRHRRKRRASPLRSAMITATPIPPC